MATVDNKFLPCHFHLTPLRFLYLEFKKEKRPVTTIRHPLVLSSLYCFTYFLFCVAIEILL